MTIDVRRQEKYEIAYFSLHFQFRMLGGAILVEAFFLHVYQEIDVKFVNHLLWWRYFFVN